MLPQGWDICVALRYKSHAAMDGQQEIFLK